VPGGGLGKAGVLAALKLLVTLEKLIDGRA